MVNRTHLVLKANDRSYFAILKKEIHTLAQSAGFSKSKIGEIDIVVAEIVSNLAKHAKDGQLFACLIEHNGIQGMEIISIDQGPGMADVKRMMGDGISTKSTLGHGLGSMKRLSDFFQCYSLKDWGTVTLVRFFEKELPLEKKNKVEWRTLVIPKPEETFCGDGAYYKQDSKYVRLFLGDGLGHGEEAAKAVETAGAAFLTSAETDPTAIIRELHAAVKKTRGLVGSVAVFDLNERSWRICGVGNIITKILGPSLMKNYMAYNGIIGLNVPNTLNAQVVPYEKDQQLIMTSDGLKTRWDTLKYFGIFRYDLSILTASLIKDFCRGTDDASVAACRINL